MIRKMTSRAERHALNRNTPASRGFTLVEMLVVFLVIAILIGILVPVISGAYQKGKRAAEVTEINSIIVALQQFKDRFGVYPPSQLALIESGDYSPTNWNSIFGVSNGEVGESPNKDGVFWRSVSVQYLRRIWPQIPISESGPVDFNGDGIPDLSDWNGDGNPTGGAIPHVFLLSGDECLVFCLGGIPSGQYLLPTGAQNRPSGVPYNPNAFPPGEEGFSKNPRFPWLQATGGVAAGRDGPFYTFDNGRLVDRDQDGFWEFKPHRNRNHQFGGYAYFSGYEGVGYRPDDFNLPVELDGTDTTSPVGYMEFRVNWQLPNGYPAAYRGVEPSPPLPPGSLQMSVRSPGPNPYTIGLPMVDGVFVGRYWKPDAFQIISPGPDNYYGQGGALARVGRAYQKVRSGNEPTYGEVAADDDNLVSFSVADVKDMENK